MKKSKQFLFKDDDDIVQNACHLTVWSDLRSLRILFQLFLPVDVSHFCWGASAFDLEFPLNPWIDSFLSPIDDNTRTAAEPPL